VQAQTQVDQLAATLSSSLSDITTPGTAVTPSASLSGFTVDLSNVQPGNTINLTYTNSAGQQQAVQIVAVNDSSALPLSSPSGASPQVIGVDLSGSTSIAAQLTAALGQTHLQFSQTGNTLQVVTNSADNVTVNSASTTTTVTGLTSGNPQLPFFTDSGSPYTGAITGSGSEMMGLAERIEVNPALLANPADVNVYSTNPPTAAGDTTRPNFLYSQLTSATFTYSPSTGLGSATAPFTGTIGNYLQQFLSQQANTASSATQLQQGQSVVVSTLQQKFNSTSQVSIDNEMSNLIALQNSYAANAHVMTVVQTMMQTLLQAQT
jgi:flagellar hook-associated protein 1 FlgK